MFSCSPSVLFFSIHMGQNGRCDIRSRFTTTSNQQPTLSPTSALHPCVPRRDEPPTASSSPPTPAPPQGACPTPRRAGLPPAVAARRGVAPIPTFPEERQPRSTFNPEPLILPCHFLARHWSLTAGLPTVLETFGQPLGVRVDAELREEGGKRPLGTSGCGADCRARQTAVRPQR